MISFGLSARWKQQIEGSPNHEGRMTVQPFEQEYGDEELYNVDLKTA